MTERTVENFDRALTRVTHLAERLCVLAQEQHHEQASALMQEVFDISFEFVDHDAILADLRARGRA